MSSLGTPPESPEPKRGLPSLGGLVEYLATARRFSPNAKLFLGYALMSQTGSGIWTVMFNLYLRDWDGRLEPVAESAGAAVVAATATTTGR